MWFICCFCVIQGTTKTQFGERTNRYFVSDLIICLSHWYITRHSLAQNMSWINLGLNKRSNGVNWGTEHVIDTSLTTLPPPQQRLQVFLIGSYMLRANTSWPTAWTSRRTPWRRQTQPRDLWWRPEVASNTASLAEVRAWSRQLEVVGSGSRWSPSLREEYNND